MIISIVAAVAENGVIGRGGDLPWDLPDDRENFRKLTEGKAVIVGRKTYESILRRLKKPLPDRRTIVISGQKDYSAEGCTVVSSLEEALVLAAGETEVFVIGGAEIYRLAMALATRMYLTRVHASVEGDTLFPMYVPYEWCVVSSRVHPKDERHQFDFTIQILERR